MTSHSSVLCLFAVVLLAAPSVSTASPEGKMKLYCQGEAAGKYNTKPVYVTLGQVSPATDGFSIEGSVDLGDQGKKTFNCIFDKQRNLKEVMATTPDGE